MNLGCRSKSLIEKYYQNIFEWFKKCEKIFGFDLKCYGQMRIYIAERFLPFWFNKYFKCLELIVFKYLRDENLI